MYHPMCYASKLSYSPGVDKFLDVKLQKVESGEVLKFSELYYYKEKRVFWIPDTDETFEFTVT